MQVNKSSEVKVGIVSVLSLIILIVGIVLVKGVSVSNEKEIKLRFPNSGGIKLSSPVVVNGVKRGTVKDIKSENNTVLITATLDNIDDLKEDVSAKISILEITGGKKIEILTGKSNVAYDGKSEIPGTASKDIGDLVGLVGDMSGDVISLVTQLDSIALHINSLLSDTVMISNLKTTISNTKDLTGNLNTFINQNKAELSSTIKNLNILAKDLKIAVQKNEPKVSKLLDSIDITVNKANKLITNLDLVSEDANKLISNVNSIVTDIKSNKSILNKIAYDKQFANDLDSAVNSISRLVDFINQNGVNVNVRLGTRP